MAPPLGGDGEGKSRNGITTRRHSKPSQSASLTAPLLCISSICQIEDLESHLQRGSQGGGCGISPSRIRGNLSRQPEEQVTPSIAYLPLPLGEVARPQAVTERANHAATSDSFVPWLRHVFLFVCRRANPCRHGGAAPIPPQAFCKRLDRKLPLRCALLYCRAYTIPVKSNSGTYCASAAPSSWVNPSSPSSAIYSAAFRASALRRGRLISG